MPGVVLFIVSFLFAIFSHGVCSSLEAGANLGSCLSVQAEHRHCEETAHTEPGGDLHICGCVMIHGNAVKSFYVQERLQKSYLIQDLNLVPTGFASRIERPPIFA